MPGETKSLSAVTNAISRVLEAGSVAALATLIEGPANVGAKLLIESDGTTTGSLGSGKLDELVNKQAIVFLTSGDDARAFFISEFVPQVSELSGLRVLFERLQPEPRLVICGAGHVGAALARLAITIGYSATLIDDRPEFVSRDKFPEEGIELVSTKSWATAVRDAVGNGRGVSVAIVTRGHNEDESCIRALTDLHPDYVGLIGSKRRTNIVLERLRDAGASEEFRQRVRAPIGLDICAITPEEVALSILAEIVAERRGGKGGSLSAWRRSERR
ncbi:MAG TPA: XdhC/CoxI family protein [Pyrinomonadaceae bacterium]|nr:XdhC/CoxI family protein [Pyrinomonadaceae bacterium]